MNQLASKHSNGPLLLVIMDGIGIGSADASNAFHCASTPCLDALMCSTNPFFTRLKAHGLAVGMPSDLDMGNSEVGHNALGAGRVFDQGAALVAHSVESGELFNSNTWQALTKNCLINRSVFHFIGLLSDGNVHSHIDHLLEMLQQLSSQVHTVRLHILLDGRDVFERSALSYIDTLESSIKKLNALHGVDYKIASGGGRMTTTMDRYHADWKMVERGWNTHVLGEAVHSFHSAREAIETFYASDTNLIDQYLPPFIIIDEDNVPLGAMHDNDSVVCFNFRGDRAIELSMAFELNESDFHYFNRKRVPNVQYAGMMQYDGDLLIPSQYLVSPPNIQYPVSEYLSSKGIRSFAISETQKYGHVTYFWNGNKSGYINSELETYIEIPSLDLPFDEQPAMQAYNITEKTIELLQSGQYDFGRINLPNGDMVGHTGNFDATVEACRVTDDCVGQLMSIMKDLNGTMIVLADHGNADEMFTIKDGKKETKTCHTLNPVPFIIIPSNSTVNYSIDSSIKHPGLTNVAATICHLLNLEPPSIYDSSLIKRL